MISSTVDTALDVTVFTVRGSPHAKDITDALERTYTKTPTANAIFDFSEASASNLTLESLVEIFRVSDSFAEQRRTPRTFVIPGTNTPEVMIRLFQEISAYHGGKVRIEIAASVEEALDKIRNS